MNNVSYTRLTVEELALFGCSFPLLSKYSMKVSVEGEIVGFVALEDKPLILRECQDDPKHIQDYKRAINTRNTYYLRKIMFSPNFRNSGLLENLFLMVNKQLPHNYSIWCRPTIWDTNGYIVQIGGFLPPPYGIRRNIVLFSLNV